MVVAGSKPDDIDTHAYVLILQNLPFPIPNLIGAWSSHALCLSCFFCCSLPKSMRSIVNRETLRTMRGRCQSFEISQTFVLAHLDLEIRDLGGAHLTEKGRKTTFSTRNILGIGTKIILLNVNFTCSASLDAVPKL